MSGLVLKNVNKIYPGGQQSVKDFSLEIRDREFLILVGLPGAEIRASADDRRTG